MNFDEWVEWKQNISYEHDDDTKRHFDELLDDWKMDREKIAVEARKEGINAHIRMKELEDGGHHLNAFDCEMCQEYKRLKEQT